METKKDWNSLRGIGKLWLYIYHRDNYKCRYCGLDGRVFDNWVYFSTDHVIPKDENEIAVRFGLKSTEQKENLVTACKYCNNVENKWQVPDSCQTWDDIFMEKKKAITAVRVRDKTWWEARISPKMNDVEIPDI